ncbi:MAG: 2-C-methyl-D-erythritol 2,4-cyclodiphosphate synthase [Clostridia bacterium]|nr:2-C-methyl-D-erythritol 2,4-cyclodiphosphate synthase [Clostridia bacterium]
MRIGHGYDVHRMVEGRKLIIGGVEIPFKKGLYGHSDADVLIHAICDALLGAAALGDIGKHFPDTDNSYKNISSIKLLNSVSNLLRNNGYRVINIDSTIIAQAPKLSPYIAKMVRNISEILVLDTGCVSVKATTEEHLGFTGSGEGIAAHAVCVIE